MNRLFDHEKLEVYQAALSFIEWLEPILQKLPKSLAVTDQLDRASTSIPLNLAEGNGKFTGPDRCRFWWG
jgi:four helix bundle protein